MILLQLVELSAIAMLNELQLRFSHLMMLGMWGKLKEGLETVLKNLTETELTHPKIYRLIQTVFHNGLANLKTFTRNGQSGVCN
jgi:hypothetical protein